MTIPSRYYVLLAALGVMLALTTACSMMSHSGPRAQLSVDAFRTVAQVLRHPRCLNCHTVTSFPRVGDDRQRHKMFVVRGPNNKGVSGMRCSSCHQDKNQIEAGVPGAPNWHIAPLSMGWEGLDDHELAEALKDSAKNGSRTLDEVREHMVHDPLVVWAWDPGEGLEAPPVTHDEFVEAFDSWLENGAVSPPTGTTTK